ncbi:globin CTT-Z-like [Culicoides brevitarsis]|uniref:globin CTT-Z-like n=1 Tax=Culicoides brevitarsis TaxID=469753 RepID=UPI00307C2040
MVPSQIQLSDEQKKLITTTWLMIRPNLMDHGVHIFVEFFERFPDNQKYFPKFEGVPISEINQFPAVRIHALNLISMFDKTISMFELKGGMEEIARIWNELGQTHKSRSLPRQSFLDMRQVILDYFARVMQLSENNKKSYATLIDWVYEIFFERQYN